MAFFLLFPPNGLYLDFLQCSLNIEKTNATRCIKRSCKSRLCEINFPDIFSAPATKLRHKISHISLHTEGLGCKELAGNGHKYFRINFSFLSVTNSKFPIYPRFRCDRDRPLRYMKSIISNCMAQ